MLKSRRSGFTLPEVLVTVAIVAVLAAVVVPAVTQQIGKADSPGFTSSANSLRTAITSFVSDVKKFPGDIEDLQVQPTVADFELSATGAAGTTYSAATVARWRGPYDNSGGTTGTLLIGYGWSTTSVVYDSLGYVVVALSKAGADSTDANALEVAIDGGGVGSNATGSIRYLNGATNTLSPANTVRLFLMSSAR